MDDIKKTYREVEDDTKKRWRNSDGEDLADLAGNAGDQARKDLGNAGDTLRHLEDETERRDEPAGTATGPPAGDRPMNP